MTFFPSVSRKPMELRHCPGPPVELWGAADNEISGEIETPEFLYGLVRLMKPAHCLELGTGMGLTTRAIAYALKDNGRGLLTSVDHDERMIAEAKRICSGLPIIYLACETEQVVMPADGLDFVLIDSGEGMERLEDFNRIAEAVDPIHGIVAIHDTGLYPDLGQALLQTPGWRGMFFPTPLGLTIMQKVPGEAR